MSRPPMRRGTKIAFGLGAVAFGVRDTGFNTFILIFYNQVLGLPATLAGLALMLTLVADSCLDPLIGLLSDSWRSRWGRRHPFLYASAVPAALTFYGLWNVPHGLNEWGLFSYLLVMSVLARACMSLFEVPFVTLVAEFTADYDQRTTLITYLHVFGWWSGLSLSLAAYGLFLRPGPGDASGMFSRHGFATFGLAGALAMLVAIIVASAGTHSEIPRLAKLPARPLALRQARQELVALLANPSVLALLASVLLLSTGQGFGNGLYNYVQVFFWGLNTSQISVLALTPFVSTILVLVLAPMLSRGREKRSLAIGFAVLAVVGQPFPIVLRLLGLFPANGGAALLPILAVHSAFETTIWVLFAIVSTSMVADLVEDHQRRTGVRAEGVLFALRIFAQKTVTGLGVLLSGLVLDHVGLATGAARSAPPAGVLDQLGLDFAGLQLGLGLASAAALLGYRVTRAGHARTVAQLRAAHLAIADEAESALDPAGEACESPLLKSYAG